LATPRSAATPFNAFLPTRPDRQIDWTLLTTQGNGRYVGTQLHVWNPRGGWWGEGDDKFFVDGEMYPSTYGTGSEDYFGDAWGLHVFDRPFHGFVQLNPTLGHFVAHRWHIADNVPFQKSFEATIEKGYHNDKPTLYDCVAYWYLSPGGTDPYPVVPVADRTGPWTPPPIYHEPDAIEGEDLAAHTDEPPNAIRIHDAAGSNMPFNLVSGDRFLSWRARKMNAKVELTIKVPADGNYQLLACFLKGRIGGVYQLRLDGADLIPPLDLYAVPQGMGMLLDGQTDLGTHHLTQGDHILSAEWIGSNPASTFAGGGGQDLDLDYIKLIPKP
jgi:hypothetical protein